MNAVSLAVEKGAIYGLVGSDGAGKSTLLRMAATMLRPSEGRILIDGLDVVSDRAAVKERIGYMPQRFGLYQDLTVEENIDFFLNVFGIRGTERKARKALYLGFSNLLPFSDRPAGKLSGGMKQKLGLACVLVQRTQAPDPRRADQRLWIPFSRAEFWGILGRNARKRDDDPRFDSLPRRGGSGATASGSCTVPSFWPPRRPKRSAPNIRAWRRQSSSGSRAADEDLAGEAFTRGGESIMTRGAFLPQSESPSAPVGEGGAIVVTDLEKRFGEFVAVNRISFSVSAGEIFRLSGAPTARANRPRSRMLCGLLIPTAGSATVAGYDVVSQTEEVKHAIGYMSQKFSLYEDLSPFENLRFYLGVYRRAGTGVARADRLGFSKRRA